MELVGKRAGGALAAAGSFVPRARAASVPIIERTRTRLFVGFLVLLAATAVIAAVGIPQVLRLRLDQRVGQALDQEIEEVDLYLRSRSGALADTFEGYLEQNVPSTGEAFAAYVDGEEVRERLRSFPGNALPPEVSATWAASTASGPAVPRRGTFDTPRGEASFATLTVQDDDGSRGMFAVAILPAAERRQIRDLQRYGLAILLGVVVLGGVLAWALTGRVLRPVRDLTETARAIAESGQEHRARVTGTGEASAMAATFNEMLDRLDAAYASQAEFVLSAGHELRAPLTVALGHLELMGDDPAELDAVRPVILDELARMGRILDDLQALAMAEQPDYVVLEPIDTLVLADQLLTKCRALAPRAWQLGRVDSATFVGDRDRVTEAVLNLADNAVHATEAGTPIELSVTVDGDDVVIAVADTGTGIDPDELDAVFDRFARGRGARRRYRGAGLGLSIVRSIAHAHGGRVEIDSAPGRGTTVRLVIPREGRGEGRTTATAAMYAAGATAGTDREAP